MNGTTVSMERWRQIELLFRGAMELPPEERQAFLDQACAGDPDLRHEVESLIAADEGSDSFMHAPVRAEAAAVGDERSSVLDAVSLSGRQIGPYKLLRELGHGGMGAVYLAERVDGQFQHQVAIKLIRSGLDAESFMLRFRNERQILASLHHPNVARLLDGGTTDDGWPYYVMEHIEGEPIDRYCDRHRLSIDQRLELFRSVCSAVHNAHQNLVVHRDIKPANILVTADGVAKLLDFGIAKLRDPGAVPFTVEATASGVRAMTPQYASPEQVLGGAITTATDVYSLGVLLYELLTGRRPYRFDSSGPREIERVICDSKPEKPSTAVRRALETGEGEQLTPRQLSDRRGGKPDWLRRKLSGDLDDIVLMAMRKEPERRYVSAQQLAEDVRLHLSGLPVIAQADTFGYRSGKFVRRHKLGVAFVASLVVFAAGMTVQTVRVAEQRDQVIQEREAADRARETAEGERERSEQVSGFLENLFQVADPGESKGEKVTARELLDKGAEAIDRELSDQPGIQATLMSSMARAYLGLGLYDDGEALCEKALESRRRLFGEDHPEVAESLQDLAEVLQLKSNYEGSEKRWGEALAIRRRRLAEEPLDVAESLNGLALVLRARGDYQGAEKRAREALEILRTMPDEPSLGSSLNALAVVLYSRGDYQGAEALFREALAARRRVLGEEHRQVATSLNNLAATLKIQAKYQEAGELYREALALRRRLFGEEHPRVATTLNNLGLLRQESGAHEEAEELFVEALAIRRGVLGDEHPAVANTMQSLAAPLMSKGDFARAEELLREALAIWREVLGGDHRNIANTMINLSVALHALGDYQGAEAVSREAVGMLRRVLGEEHPEVANSLDILARSLQAQGDYRAAEGFYRRGLEMFHRLEIEENLSVATTLTDLAGLLIETGEFVGAESPAREALRINRQLLNDGHWRIRFAENTLGACLTGLGRYQEAEPLLLDSYPILKDRTSARSPETRAALRRLVTLYRAWGRPEKAEEYVRLLESGES